MTGHAIHIKLDGRTYSGTYKVDRQLLTVTTNYGKKAGQVVPRKSHEALAQELLQELVREETATRAISLSKVTGSAAVLTRPRSSSSASLLKYSLILAVAR